ncbi:MAG: signal peptidase I [Clostridia bacterium]|nr:signal peptidase I [Clostridia bacterium]
MAEDFQDINEPTILDENDLESGASRRRQWITAVICVLIVVILAVTLALIVKTYVIATFTVDGSSMYPTLNGGGSDLNDGETLYLNRLAKVKRGDIVVFTPDWDSMLQADGTHKSLVKRVIAVAGDAVQIVDRQVYLNGKPLDEPYIKEQMSDRFDGQSWTVPEGYIFCMGDNRNNSTDCRVYGPVPVSCVVGKCFLVKGTDGKLHKP